MSGASVPSRSCGVSQNKQSNFWLFHRFTSSFILFGNFYQAAYFKTPQALHCTADIEPLTQFNTPDNPWPVNNLSPIKPSPFHTRTGYGTRPTADWFPAYVMPTGGDPRLNRLKNKALVADIVSTRTRIIQRHKTGANVLYGDGSARWVPLKAFDLSYNAMTPDSLGFSNANDPYVLNEPANAPATGVWADLDRN